MEKAEREREGEKLKRLWLAHKELNPDDTQEAFAERVGITQGFLQQVFRGTTPAPFETLLHMAIDLDFDPRVVRPRIDETVKTLNRALSGRDDRRLEARLSRLSDKDRNALLLYIRGLESQEEDN